MPFDISGAIVFGSRVKGEATPDSDFDLLGSSSPQRKLVMNSRSNFNISLWERAVELEYNEREKERVEYP